MADHSQELLLEALERAAREPGGVPLYGSRRSPGLFAASAIAKKTAQLSKDRGYLHTLRVETKGKTAREICGITESGLALLLEQATPNKLLQSFIQALEDRQTQFHALSETARNMQANLAAMQSAAEKVLQKVQVSAPSALPCDNGSANGAAANSDQAILGQLRSWQSSHGLEDCPLPDLFQLVRPATIGQFHDALRRLHGSRKLELHPWTGPMYEIPEPAYALLAGHVIAYYASSRP